MIYLVAHLTRQAVFSRATFGPGPRTKGVIDHVKKELREVEKVYEVEHVDPLQAHEEAAKEWTDVAILGLDGLLRSISAANPRLTYDQVAQKAWHLILNKQGVNEMREWPDWRTVSPDKAVEHDRSGE